MQTGILAVWPDSLYFADRARHVLEQGNFAQSGMYPANSLPLYALTMIIGFAFPDIATGHKILLVLQTAALAMGFFPLRALLSRHTALSFGESCLMAAAGILLPALFSYAPFLISNALLVPLLLYGVYFLDRIFSGSNSLKDGVGAGMFLGLAVLTQNSAWSLWLAALVTLVPLLPKQKQACAAALLLPIGFMLGWTLYGHFSFDFSFNNALARFNFVKNAILYYLYGGAPLAGLALILAGLMKGKSFWDNPFFRFSFLTLAALALYVAFTNGVIVDRKLDYITNRAIDPYLFLPLIVLFRLDGVTRKEMLGNGMLLFFVLAVFGFPYALNLDFRTGMAFWGGPLPGAATPIVRDVLYILAISVPALLIYLRPRWFVMGYTFIAFFMVAFGLMAAYYFWHTNENARLAAIDAAALSYHQELRKADAIYVDYGCSGRENNDVAYLFRCFDMNKALYFLPRLPQQMSTEQLLQLPPDKLKNAVFATSENDNLWGSVAAQSELASFMRVTPRSITQAKTAPVVEVSKIMGMSPYMSMLAQGIRRRLTVLAPNAEIVLNSDRAGCAVMEAEFYMNEYTREVSFQLGNAAVRKISIPPARKGQHAPYSFVFSLPKGEATFHIRYGDEKTAFIEGPSLIMLDRPVIKACGGK